MKFNFHMGNECLGLIQMSSNKIKVYYIKYKLDHLKIFNKDYKIYNRITKDSSVNKFHLDINFKNYKGCTDLCTGLYNMVFNYN